MPLKPAVRAKDNSVGNKDASLVIVEFGDYQCPICGAAFPVIKKMIEEFGGHFNFVFRNFPLSEIHPYARPAALAAEAAALQGKFWEMHCAIYENQRKFTDRYFQKLANTIVADPEKFSADVKGEETSDKVDHDFESGIRSGVNRTPTFFIDGKIFDGGAEELYQIIKEKKSYKS